MFQSSGSLTEQIASGICASHKIAAQLGRASSELPIFSRCGSLTTVLYTRWFNLAWMGGDERLFMARKMVGGKGDTFF